MYGAFPFIPLLKQSGCKAASGHDGWGGAGAVPAVPAQNWDEMSPLGSGAAPGDTRAGRSSGGCVPWALGEGSGGWRAGDPAKLLIQISLKMQMDSFSGTEPH